MRITPPPAEPAFLAGDRSQPTFASALQAECLDAQVPDAFALRAAFTNGHCATLATEGEVVVSSIYNGPFGRLPLLVMADTRLTVPRRLVIQLVGGPGGSAFVLPDPRADIPEPVHELFRGLLRQGDAIITPAYAGSSERSFYPHSDLPRALAELRALLSDLQRRFPNSELILLGWSLGGYLAARLSPDFPGVRLVLVNPVLWTPRELLTHGEETWDGEFPLELAHVERTIWADAEDGGSPSLRSVPLHESGRRFYGNDVDRSAIEYLIRSRAKTTIIYSRNDTRTGASQIFRLAQRPNLQLIETGTPGHFFESEHDQRLLVRGLRRGFADSQ